MKLKRTLIKTLDSSVGRPLLSWLVTQYARRHTERNVKVFFDGQVWIRSLDDETFVTDSTTFDYAAADITEFPAFVRRLTDELADYWFHLYQPQAGDVIVDVGAGIGLDTRLFSRVVGEQGKVLAIEAHPATFRLLEKMCVLNRLTNVTRRHVAVTDRQREVFIETVSDRNLNTTSLALSARHNRRVNGFSLDEICEQEKISHIDFLKMNIEGAEQVAINGMTETIKKIQNICIACHDFRADDDCLSPTFSTREAVTDFLRRHDFQIVIRHDDARHYVRDHLHAVRR